MDAFEQDPYLLLEDGELTHESFNFILEKKMSILTEQLIS